MVKNLPANARRHKRRGFDLWVGKIPPEEGGLAWRIPWTEGPGRLLSLGFIDSDMTERLGTNTVKIATLLGAGAWQIQVLLFETFWKFFQAVLTCSCFNLQMQNPQIQRTDAPTHRGWWEQPLP